MPERARKRGAEDGVRVWRRGVRRERIGASLGLVVIVGWGWEGLGRGGGVHGGAERRIIAQR